MRKLLCIYLLSSFYALLPAQTFSGKIIDGTTSEPLEFANAILMRSADSTFVAGTVSDSLGNFEIKTKQGEGLSGSFVARAIKDRKFSHYETVNLNYRKDKLDLFGMFRYSKSCDRTYLELGQNTNSNDIQTDVIQKGWQEMLQEYYRTNIGANYAFDKDNSVGVKFQHNGNIQQDFSLQSDFTAYTNKTLSEQFSSNTMANNNPNSNYLNAYYNGKPASWLSAKLNIDYAYGSGYTGHISNNIRPDSTEIISTQDRNNYDLYAGKLILTTPLFNGELNYGYEVSKTINNQQFTVLSKGESDILEPSDNSSKQLLNAVFLSYSKQIGLFASEIGVRYEHVDFEYFDGGIKDLESSKLYNNWLPEASISYQKKKLQMQLSYRNSTSRPSYYQLRSEVQYDNPYTYEAGNPYLRPTMINTLSYILSYSNLQSSVSYNMYKDLILFAPTMLSTDIICAIPQNFQNCRDLQISVSYSPTIKFWQPSLEVNLGKYFYNVGNPPQTYNKPVLSSNFKNSFTLPRNLNITSEFTYNTRGNSGIDYIYNYFCANVYVSKLFLNKKLKINIGAENLFNLEKQKFETKMNGINMSVFKDNNTQNVYISATYNFNATKNKYKGEQASDELNRL